MPICLTRDTLARILVVAQCPAAFDAPTHKLTNHVLDNGVQNHKDEEDTMLPPTMLVPHEELLYPAATTPELRRMDMFHRARREEMESLLLGVNPRHSMTIVSNNRNAHESFTISRIFNGLRNGLGNMLVSAGNRIQSPA